ncbi:G patch domain-containing protein 11-like [Gigantopelta aegis]|uniref:G patch domain-containing protein 11-like n=1 Tax=Gigantopelta aegis TaxID=1735272 RepID=UPI001B88E0FC|nr:G patch domain-containing protein 11-like [Gigantopelta aegis]
MCDEDSEEDDYMSDKILQQCPNTRPGLVPDRIASKYGQQKKQNNANQSNKSAFKPVRVLEKEKREDGLRKSLTSSNKGFAMLQKMGYKPGMAIGKTGSGRMEPVPIEVKFGRGGLGKEADLKRKQTNRIMMATVRRDKRQKFEVEQHDQFIQRRREVQVDRRTENDLCKSQKVCEQLDSQKDIERPLENFFWPKELLPTTKKPCTTELNEDTSELRSTAWESDDDDNDDDDDVNEEADDESSHLSSLEKLQLLTSYLRRSHKYCLWCGTNFTDDADMEANCPGDTAEAHDD